MLINMSNSTSFNVSVKMDMNLYPLQMMGSEMRHEYHLTPKDGDVQSDVVLLNGSPLNLTLSLDIPQMEPIAVDASSPIQIAADSIVFAHLPYLNAPACA